MTDPARTQDLARRMLQGTSEDILEEAQKLILAGAGKGLFEALLKSGTRAAASEGDRIQELMRLFENVMDSNPTVGSYLMGRLYSVAARKRGEHTVANAIELWMAASDSPAAADGLRCLNRESFRPSLRIRFTAWEDAIRARSGEK